MPNHMVGNSPKQQTSWRTKLAAKLNKRKPKTFILAGISFDLAKCFDTVPFNLALDVFSARGADVRIVQTLRSFYISHHFFRLEGSYLPSYKPTCGIVQGCPLSM